MFITLEGIEGSGKTTQIRHIAEYIKSKGHDCVITREPGGTGIGKKIRAILLDSNSKGLDPSAELLLYIADRIQHVNEIIRPALSLGKTVLCDRYFDATIAYQGFARGIDMDLITMLHKRVVENLRPDITILLDLPAETGLKRAWEQINHGARTSSETRFEEEKITFHENVRAGYLKLACMEPERFRIIDAARNEKTVKEDVLEALSL
jgi:dTMP kinase